MRDGHDWLDQMWFAGYCDETVRAASKTSLDSAGSQERLAWMEEHVPGCQECLYANFMKHLEATIASQLDADELFRFGGDVVQVPGFEQKMSALIDAEIKKGRIDEDVVTWMETIAERHGTPWPGRVH